jgi:sugar lactone lactonase YvrE
MMRTGAGVEVRFTEAAESAVMSVGRTEDLRFSPDNRLLAITGFNQNSCLVLRVNIAASADGIVVSADDFVEITSRSLRYPHGLDFIDDETLVVANRGGGLSILRLPDEFGGRVCQGEVLWQFPGGRFRWMRSPGSVVVRHEDGGLVSLLTCNNYSHRVTRHVLDRGRDYRLVRKDVCLRRGLIIPDGIALSHDGRWVAVSSHGTHDVKLYAASGELGSKSEPVGTLSGAGYPHGLQFSADDAFVLVADAGSQVVNVYQRGAGWDGEHRPLHSFEVIDDEAFARGRHNIEEGGPKGLAIDRTGELVAITCEEQPLALYTLGSILRAEAAAGSSAESHRHSSAELTNAYICVFSAHAPQARHSHSHRGLDPQRRAQLAEDWSS